MRDRPKCKAVQGLWVSTSEQIGQVENEDEASMAKSKEVFEWSFRLVTLNEEDLS